MRALWLVFVAFALFALWNYLVAALGLGALLVPVVVVGLTMMVWLQRLSLLWDRWHVWLGALVFTLALLGLLAFFTPEGLRMDGPIGREWSLQDVSLGGRLGQTMIAIRSPDTASAGQTVLGILRVVGLLLVGAAFVAPRWVWQNITNGVSKAVPALGRAGRRVREAVGSIADRYSENPLHERALNWLRARRVPLISRLIRPREEKKAEKEEKKKRAPRPVKEQKVVTAEVVPAAPGEWRLPDLTLLDETANAELSKADIDRRAKVIEEALASYGVDAKVKEKNVGPAVTQFEVEPGWDIKYKDVKEKDRNGNIRIRKEEVSRTRVKVERITALQNDLALALAAPSIRVEAPVPGKAVVGIEVPNTSSGLVSVREVLESAAFRRLSSKSPLAIALGKGTAGDMAVADLAKMPHVLIAGATGSGKTVCLDATIISLLMNNTPRELRFIMIDPKRVELIAFDGVPHLMTPVITEGEKAVDILKWLTHEMDSRYRRLADNKVHNIDAYNRNSRVTKPMPYIVLVVDELADLMMSHADEIERELCRLAQMGRAVGIHCVVATQRPSVDVITGLIKANFPTRISFAVASLVDSRTILDQIGAEKLLGRGDMLYLSAELAKPKRLQGCYVSQQEIERVTRFWADQARSQPVEVLTYSGEQAIKDPLLEQVKQLAKEHKQLSASYLQRQLRIGSARAEELLRQLQEAEAQASQAAKPPEPQQPQGA
ncbi:MAG: DNA translocase FtsK [Dehalococcoidia bacterium]|nr:DNA translocase FtsK [Dehalococcoidia bacterium]